MAETELLMSLTSPLEDGMLRFRSMVLDEEIGRPFEMQVVGLSDEPDIDPYKLLAHPISVSVQCHDDTMRHFHGMVSEVTLNGPDGRRYAYGLTVRPMLWMLTRRSNLKVFQDKNALDIVKAVFGDYPDLDMRDDTQGSYTAREFCVQYRESDFNFVSRLLEQEGIAYYFEHAEDKHTMVLIDAPGSYPASSSCPTVPFRESVDSLIDLEAITEWRFGRAFQTGKFTLRDHNFETPGESLEVKTTQSHPHPLNELEQYDYPGQYAKKKDGQQYSEVRLDELQAQHPFVHGAGSVRGLAAGHRFKLQDHPRRDQNAEHLIVSTRIEMGYGSYESGNGTDPHFTCRFTALPAKERLRPARTSHKPTVAGIHTAVVVGPAGEELYVDKYGRVKVQFHWDRLGEKNANSSCWVRVATSWAGKQWGMISLPRIGHEVVINFLEGDPDRPLITGAVYNAANMPPYTLPDNATVSTVKSQSSKGGTTSNANELRFEDKKGSEYVWFQAEKDHFHLVKHDVNSSIGNDEFNTVKKDRKEKVGGVHHLTVDKDVMHKFGAAMNLAVTNDMLYKVGGQHSLKVTKDICIESSATISEKAGSDMQVKVGKNLGVAAGMNVHIKGGMNIVVEAGMMLTLKAGSNSVVIGPSGVSITGTMVLINSGGSAGSGDGANPVAPTPPDPPENPPVLKDPLGSK